jgi:integrase
MEPDNMARRQFQRLTAARVNRLKSKPGRHPDGDGLYLDVTDEGVQSWTFRFTMAGRERNMGFGPLRDISLAAARELAADARRLKRAGLDPLEQRRAARVAAALEAARAMTFRQCAEAYIAAHAAGWRNAEHRRQWSATLASYAYPKIGHLPVAAVDVGLVLKIVEPLWRTRTETASRLRGRIELVIDWATARGYRTGENPARWKGHLENLLPRRRAVQKVKHLAAVPYTEVPALMAQLRAADDIPAHALEFLILTAARSGEAIGARWDEIDRPSRLWTIPAERMKGGREHKVPLSDRTVVILEEMAALRVSDLVFPGRDADRPLSKTTPVRVLRRLGHREAVVHGLRSSFATWAAERTNYPHEIREAALAHAIPSAVERAYRRTTMLDRRRRLMADWAAYCGSGGALLAEVVPFAARG